MHKIFFDNRGLLRSGWRAAIFLFAFICAGMVLHTITIAAFLQFGIDTSPGTSAFLITNAVISLMIAIVLGWMSGWLLEHLPFKALGASFTPGWLRNFALGCLIGGVTFGVAVLVAIAAGGLRFELFTGEYGLIASSLASSLVIFAVAAAFEEAFFRGYILQTFARSGLAWLAILLTSAAFAVAHLNNPNANTIGALNTFLAGIWLSIAYLKTRDLWFVWGVHLMWNWVQGSIFGVEVSGMTSITAAPLLREIDAGPEWLTGGTYGIEGGISCTLALLISTAVIYFIPWVKADEEMVALTSTSEIPVA